MTKLRYNFAPFTFKEWCNTQNFAFDSEAYIKSRKNITEMLILTIGSDTSYLSIEQKFKHISDIVFGFIYYDDLKILEEFLYSISSDKRLVKSVIGRFIPIRDLIKELDRLDSLKTVVFVFKDVIIKLVELYIYFSLYPYLMELSSKSNDLTFERLQKEIQLTAGVKKRINENKINLDKIRGLTKGRVSLINMLNVDTRGSILPEEFDALLLVLKSSKFDRKAYDTFIIPIILESIIFSKEISEYSASKYLIPLVNLICKTKDFIENEEDWLNSNSPDKNYVSYCYKSISNHFYR